MFIVQQLTKGLLMNDIVKQENRQTLQTFVYQLEERFDEIKINNQMKFRTEAQFALQILRENKFLLGCAMENKASLQHAILNISTTGLSLNPAQKLAYLVPRNKKVCLDFSYQGLMKLATDCGSIKYLQADVIHEHDEYVENGIFEVPTFKKFSFSKEKRGAKIGAFCVAITHDNKALTTSMGIDEIYEIRDNSDSYKYRRNDNIPWIKFEDEMIKKTVIKRAYKTFPKSDRYDLLNVAIMASNDADPQEFTKKIETFDDAIQADIEANDARTEIQKQYLLDDGSVNPKFVLIDGKFRSKALEEIDNDECDKYLEHLQKRKDKKPWQWAMIDTLTTWREQNAGVGE
jgi:recombination protein RecT